MKAWWQKLTRFIDSHYWWLHPLLTACVTASGAFLTYHLSDDYNTIHPVKADLLGIVLTNLPIFFWVSLAFLIIVTFINEHNRKTNKQLATELENEREKNELIADNIEQLFNGILMQVSTLLNFNNNEERVTLYLHDGNQTFVPCGRYSLDPEFRKKGRPEYSDSQGCINRGWRHGWHFDNQFGNTEAEHKR